MVANPHSAKSDKVLEALEQRNEILPDNIWAEINAGKSQISAKQALEIEISNLLAEKAVIRNHLLQNYQDENKTDSLRWLMNQLPDALSAYREIWTWFDEGNTGYGLNAIQNLDLTALPENHRSYHNGYIELAEVINQLVNDSTYVIQNDSLGFITLQNLVAFDNPAGIAARNLLTAYRLMNYEATIPVPDNTSKSATATFNNPKKAKKDKTAIYVFPNPANDYTILSYSIEVSGTMQLVSQEGRVVRFENLKSGTNQFLLRTGGLPSGVYTVKINADNQVLTSKLIIK